jgi:exopolysaccharide biosynthesis polyprenyl glycosylphosphotransferase
MLNVSLDQAAGTISEVKLRYRPEIAPFIAAPREKHVKVYSSFARAALKWPIGIWGTLDALAAFSLFLLAHHLSPHYSVARVLGYQLWTSAAVYAGLLLCLCYAQGLYDRHNLASFDFIVRAALIANLLALAGTSLGFGWVRFVSIGRWVIVQSFFTSAASIILIRIVARSLAHSAKARILFVGDRSKFRPLERELRHRFRSFYHRPVYADLMHLDPAMCEKRLLQAVRLCDPDEIVVQDSNKLILSLLSQSATILDLGCEIRSHTSYYEELLRQVPVEAMDHRAMLGDGLKNSRYGINLSKRLLDVGLAAFGLIVGLPIMLIVALFVRLAGPGPIFYKQTRVGRYGRTFSIYKFRTMRVDAEKNGAVWAKCGDTRVTRVGGFLRKSRLDELPQLWNIIRGDMSFVGPRPERPEFVNDLRTQIPHYDLRHLVPPGLTGWAQVRYRYGASVQDAQRKLAFDLYYVRHYSPGFDLAICLRTAVAMAKGAR